MSGIAPQRETKETVTLTLPSGLACKLAERADAMHVSVDAIAIVLLKYGLEAQQQRENDLRVLVDRFLDSPDEESKQAAFEEIGQSVFGK